MKRAVYAFSGDPITFGHINIVERTAKIFDEVLVTIGQNPDKKYMFDLVQREQMAKKALEYLKNVKVTSFTGLLVDFAYENDINIIIRGIRNEKDFNYEIELQGAGKSQQIGIETLFMPADPKFAHISSSLAKALQIEHGDVHNYVPLNVKQALEKQISDQYILGVTGEIGSGKSYVADKFVELGKEQGIEVYNIELDDVGHKILEKLEEPIYLNARKKIAIEFGEELLKTDGTIDRKQLGEIVFADMDKLSRLNEILHELILLRLKKELADKKGIIILNAALFAETDMLYLFNNNILLVGVDKEIQRQRLQAKGYNDEQIQRRLATQFDYNEKQRIINEKITKDNYGHLFTIDNSKEGNHDLIRDTFNQIKTYFEI